jgi:hypothetical protein
MMLAAIDAMMTDQMKQRLAFERLLVRAGAQ